MGQEWQDAVENGVTELDGGAVPSVTWEEARVAMATNREKATEALQSTAEHRLATANLTSVREESKKSTRVATPAGTDVMSFIEKGAEKNSLEEALAEIQKLKQINMELQSGHSSMQKQIQENQKRLRTETVNAMISNAKTPRVLTTPAGGDKTKQQSEPRLSKAKKRKRNRTNGSATN